jgi:hypothetical protein
MKRSSLNFAVFVALGVLFLSIYAWYRYEFPFGMGMRSAMMPCTMSALRIYADRNGGWFPRQTSAAASSFGADALRQLVPVYLNAANLAGISGNIREVERRVRMGQELDQSVSSWIYWPGFRDDDPPQLAIIWERSPGVTGTGRRTPAGWHAVGFADGTYEMVSPSKWETFVKEQEQLRAQVLATRTH